MECKKFSLLLVATAAVLLVSVAPPATAARNKALPLSIIADANIRNPLANIFWVDMPTEECYAKERITIN
ncbi:hypothetical protein V6N13_107561 [Hibiscus sabdariffa]